MTHPIVRGFLWVASWGSLAVLSVVVLP